MIRTAFISLCLLAALLSGRPAFAQDAEPAAGGNRPEVLKADYRKIESLGLYTSPREGSLGRDLWSNSRRSVILDLIPRLQPPGSSKVLQDMTYGVLLSETDARLIENDIPVEPGKDLLTVRLLKLLDIGAYDKALKIYSSLNEEPYHPELARAGILALMFNGEKSLACLDYKIVEDRGFSGEFWNDLDLYCRSVLEEGGEESVADEGPASDTLRAVLKGGHSVPYSAKTLDDLPLFDRALLAAEKAIKFDTSAPASIAPQHVLLALQKEGLSEEERFLLTMRAVRYGLVSKGEWQTRYETFNLQNEAYTGNQVQVDTLPLWKKLPGLYANVIKVDSDAERWAIVRQAFDVAGQMDMAGLYPFAEVVSRLDPEGIDAKTVKTAALLLYQTDMRGRYNEAYNAALIPMVQRNIPDSARKTMDYVIEIIDNPSANPHNAGNVYEKDFDLTFGPSYVMPSMQIWYRVRVSSQNQSIGETVLLSTLVLHGQNANELYPGFLKDILDGFSATGLSRVSVDLAHEAFFDWIENKG